MPTRDFPKGATPKLLSGKIALVTGGMSGIGKSIASLFFECGAKVIVADLSVPEGLDWSDCEFGRSAYCDVADEAAVMRLAELVRRDDPQIDVLVNCAGMPQTPVALLDASVKDWDRIMAVNARSIFLMTKHFVQALEPRRGNVINICSSVGLQAKAGLAAYGASKAAAISTTKALALELAAKGIRVNAINPGAVETPMLSGFSGGKPVDEVMTSFQALVPMGEIVQPSDVAGAALYLASDLARLVTGAVLAVDGGRGA